MSAKVLQYSTILTFTTAHIWQPLFRYENDESLAEITALEFTYTKGLGYYVGWHVVNLLLFYVLPFAILYWDG